MRVHVLKCWSEPFKALIEGVKAYEYRKDDGRDFRRGDLLMLLEFFPAGLDPFAQKFVPEHYTGRIARGEVTYITKGPAFGVPDGFVVMSLTGVGQARFAT